MKNLHFPIWAVVALFSMVLTLGCGGPDMCKCLEEADKENPNPSIMEKCRDAFSKMEMDQVQEAVKKCGR